MRFYQELTAQYYCIFDELSNEMNGASSHHSYALTIRANPSRSVTNSPLIFFEALFTNLKTAGATPAKSLFFLTTVTPIFTKPLTSVIFFLFCHNY